MTLRRPITSRADALQERNPYQSELAPEVLELVNKLLKQHGVLLDPHDPALVAYTIVAQLTQQATDKLTEAERQALQRREDQEQRQQLARSKEHQKLMDEIAKRTTSDVRHTIASSQLKDLPADTASRVDKSLQTQRSAITDDFRRVIEQHQSSEKLHRQHTSHVLRKVVHEEAERSERLYLGGLFGSVVACVVVGTAMFGLKPDDSAQIEALRYEVAALHATVQELQRQLPPPPPQPPGKAVQAAPPSRRSNQRALSARKPRPRNQASP